MDEEIFNMLSKEQKIRLSSDFRKTIHSGEMIFSNESDVKKLSLEDQKFQLLKERDKLLEKLATKKANE